jgi:hypothetical protein
LISAQAWSSLGYLSVSSQKIGKNKTIFRQTHYMTIEVRDFVPICLKSVISIGARKDGFAILTKICF